MAKAKSKRKTASNTDKEASAATEASTATTRTKKDAGKEGVRDELSGKAYAKALKALHIELVKLQLWVQAKGLKVCVVFEAGMAPAKAAPSRRSPSE